MPPVATRSTATRQRLLEAAGEVFAEDGFRKATIQRICGRARANIAAAHYHFGDKARLYTAVIEYSTAWRPSRCRRRRRPAGPRSACASTS